MPGRRGGCRFPSMDCRPGSGRFAYTWTSARGLDGLVCRVDVLLTDTRDELRWEKPMTSWRGREKMLSCKPLRLWNRWEISPVSPRFGTGRFSAR
jgi:hypothetical protein